MVAKGCFVAGGGSFREELKKWYQDSFRAQERAVQTIVSIYISSLTDPIHILKGESALFDLPTNDGRMQCLSLKTLFVSVGSVSNSDYNGGDGLRQPKLLEFEHGDSSFCNLDQ